MKQLGISIGIIVAAVVVGAAVIFSIQGNDISTQKTRAVPVVTPTPEVDSKDYEGEIQEIISEYGAQPSIAKAVEAQSLLLALRVPKEYRDLHLDLVLYFDAQVESQTIDTTQLQQLVAPVTWLRF